ncbi:hypothetical protein DOY81_001677 [Sarcophaga bullata]|nr:hypothetical protein DOY81_001677 [Sarcophaga bullata]
MYSPHLFRTVLLFLIYQLQNVMITAQKDLVCQILKENSYGCEAHKIRTKDDYILTVHRIPPPPPPSPPVNTSNTSPTHSISPKPVILMHGLIGSASDFVLPGRNRALSALLHEQGYDVWLPNARGTTYSKKHAIYDSSQPEFWNFTWHEMGVGDLPAIVDYVLNYTQHSSLHYMAHSQGSTTLFVMLSEKPEYNEKIATGHLLAPVAFLKDIKSPPFRVLAEKSDKVEALLNHLGLHELFPSTALNQLGGHLLCGNGVPTQNLCLLLTFLSVGFSDFQMDRNLFPRIFETTPAGISRKQFQHFGQLITSGKINFCTSSSAASSSSPSPKLPPSPSTSSLSSLSSSSSSLSSS